MGGKWKRSLVSITHVGLNGLVSHACALPNPQHATHMAEHSLSSCIKDQKCVWHKEDVQDKLHYKTTVERPKHVCQWGVGCPSSHINSSESDAATQQMEGCGFKIAELIVLSSTHRPQIWISKMPELFI